MPKGIVLVVPIAHDLIRTEEGIRCGPGTAAACDHAIEVAKRHAGSSILVTATRAGKEFDNVPMWAVMESYLTERSKDRTIVREEADRFNTLGEILAVVAYMKRMRKLGIRFEEVVFTVKGWHAGRVERLANEAFALHGVLPPIRVESHEAPGTWWEKVLEGPKTIRHLRQLHRLCVA